MRRKTFSVFALLLIAALVVTACAPAATAPAAPAASSETAPAAGDAATGAMTEVGAGEGQLDIIAWAGYIERGETDPAYDWVTKMK